MRPGGEVRVDVAVVAVGVPAEGGHHRQEAVVEQVVEDGGVDLLDLADAAEVLAVRPHRGTDPQQPGVGAGHADGRGAGGLDQARRARG